MPGGQAHSQNPQQPCPQGYGLDDKGYGNDKMFSAVPKLLKLSHFCFLFMGLKTIYPTQI
jgi:hypothetical protein